MATKNLTLEILNVGEVGYTKTARGGYSTLEVAYKNEGKVEGKKLVDFNNKDVFNFVKDLKPGDVIQITTEKKEEDKFWNWVGVTIATGGVAVPAASGAPTVATNTNVKSVGRVTGSNYETPEERAKKQVYIVRQSSISSAIEFAKQQGNVPSIEDILEVAAEFEAFVFSTGETPVADDIPL